MIDRLRVVLAEVEKLPDNEQEYLAALLEENLAEDTHWHELFQRPSSQAFFASLRAEAEQAEQEGTLEESPDEDWG